MDMSLDDIISKKGVNRNTRKGFITKSKQRNNQWQRGGGGAVNRPIQDARNLIIQKKRNHISDARDLLVEKTRFKGDARERLSNKKVTRKSFPPATVRRPPPPKQRPVEYLPVPRGYVDHDNMEQLEQEEIAGLRRTIQNDLLSKRKQGNRSARAEVDPFPLYHVPKRAIPMDVMDVDMEEDLPVDIHRALRRRSDTEAVEYSHLSSEMKNRLQNPPEIYGNSHGIFSNPLKKMSPGSSPQGYRIVVSNLHNSVTESDIKELFEDIGELYDARLVRNGVAEVVYKKLKDAALAVETYHNRQLDSLPMKCLLVKPRSSDNPTAPALKNSDIARNTRRSSFDIDIDALHKALFRRK